MTTEQKSKDRVAELRERFDKAGRWGGQPASWGRSHTEELFRIIDALRRERDISATVAGRALTELHKKIATGQQTSKDLTECLRAELEKRAFHHGDGQFSKIEYCDFCGYSKEWLAHHEHGGDCLLRRTYNG